MSALPDMEPAAMNSAADLVPDCALISIAISLKRIADAVSEQDNYGQTGFAAITTAIYNGLRDGRR